MPHAKPPQSFVNRLHLPAAVALMVAGVWLVLVFADLARPQALPAPFTANEQLDQRFRPLYNEELAAGEDRDMRNFWQKPRQLLDQLQPLEGLLVADIGAGTGYFTEHLAQRVGSAGHVIATDISQPVLETLAKEIKPELRGRVSLVLADEDRLGIETPVDLIWVVQVFGEIDDKSAFLGRLQAIMHRDTRLVIIDSKHLTDPVTGFTRPINLNALRQQFAAVGLEIAPGYPLGRFNFLPKQYCFVLRKAGGDATQ